MCTTRMAESPNVDSGDRLHVAAFGRGNNAANRNAVIAPEGQSALTRAPLCGQPEFSTPMAGLPVEMCSVRSSCNVHRFRSPPCPVT